MLGKLFKYEFKATSRWLLPSYLFLLMMSVINMFLVDTTVNSGLFVTITGSNSDSLILNMIESLFVMAYGIAIAAVGMITTFVIVTRFYKNLLSNEGYISMTLPVSVDEHLAVKLITALTWTFLSVIMIVISFLIILAPAGLIGELREVFRYLPEVYTILNIEVGGKLGLYILNFVMNAIVSMIQAVIMFYFAMAIGQLSNNHKVGMSVIAYIVINFILQIISTVLMGNMIMDLTYVNDSETIMARLSQYGFIGLIFGLVITISFYFGTRYILTKRINLQ